MICAYCKKLILIFLLCIVLPALSHSQVETATISGVVTDQSGAVVAGAEVLVTNTDTNVSRTATTNASGVYVVTGLRPGPYRIRVKRDGFNQIDLTDFTLNVQDDISRNFTLRVGSTSESISVGGKSDSIETSGAVSTVIDRNFVERLPLNGRTFNTLLQLTPGVVIAPNPSGATSQGQFSIAGQRTDANSFTVDGVSANFGVGIAENVGESGTGGAQALSVMGATGSLISADALQEFRIETSSFAPEFGKTPGGQVILTSRSGTNEFHGTIFDYFRNTAMDANDWFANRAGQPRAAEHHNDFGGVFGGPIWKDKSFFFFSYEGARLRLPQTVVTQVPSKDARTSAPSALAPYLNAYPQPNGPISPGDATAQFTGSLSNPATLNATSLRIDHSFSQRIAIFGRYNYAPSEAQSPFGPSTSLSNPSNTHVDTQTLTVGLNIALGTNALDEVRGNYSSQTGRGSASLNSLGGAVPLNPSLLLGTFPTAQDEGQFTTFDTTAYTIGNNSGRNRTRQADFTDALSLTRGSHQLKFGGDYRAIFLDVNAPRNTLLYFASDVPTFLSTGSVTLVSLAVLPAQFLSESSSIYAQDSWKVTPRLTFTYGVRWELSPAPSARGNTTLAAWQNVTDPTKTALAPIGAPLWATTYDNFAPRFGVAYSLTSRGDVVLRAGTGIFYDLGAGESANLAFEFPNASFAFFPSVSVPVTNINSFLATNFSRQPPYGGFGFDPNLTLPRSYQWNLALEKSFGSKQTISATYVGQTARDQLRNTALFQPNSNFTGNDFILTQNSARSNYNALQIQFRRSLSSRLQALANYSWSHSLDNASDDVVLAIPSNVISGVNDYASSIFDVRHSFSGAISFDIPGVTKSGVLRQLTNNWSIESVVVARSGFPFNAQLLFASPDPLRNARSRPDLVPGQPLWIPNPAAAGGQSLNPSAFAVPPVRRQGTEGRNDIPGFGLTQADISIGRKFPLSERTSLQFRTDAFNVFNHPNFANPSGFIEFGPAGLKSFEMLNQGLGGLNPLFQEGGPRSLQVSLRLAF